MSITRKVEKTGIRDAVSVMEFIADSDLGKRFREWTGVDAISVAAALKSEDPSTRRIGLVALERIEPEAKEKIAEFHARLIQALEELPTDQRHVFLLHYVEGVALDEIARETGISKEKVNSEMSYVVVRLIKILGGGIIATIENQDRSKKSYLAFLDFYLDEKNSLSVLGSIAIASGLWGVLTYFVGFPGWLYVSVIAILVVVSPILLALITNMKGTDRSTVRN